MTEIDDLLEMIETPRPDPAADVMRGERSLRRRRRMQVSAAAVSVAAVAALGVVVQGSSGSPGAHGGFAGRGSIPTGHSASAIPTPPSADQHQRISQHHAKKALTAEQRMRQLMQMDSGPATTATLQGYRNVLAEHLDPGGSRLQLAQNVGGGTGHLGTKLDWDHGGMLQISVSTSWHTSDWNAYPPRPGKTITFRGHQARVLTDGSDLYVAVEHDDGQVVTLIASPSFGNNGTSIATTGLTVPQLLAAAADPRLALPTRCRPGSRVADSARRVVHPQRHQRAVAYGVPGGVLVARAGRPGRARPTATGGIRSRRRPAGGAGARHSCRVRRSGSSRRAAASSRRPCLTRLGHQPSRWAATWSRKTSRVDATKRARPVGVCARAASGDLGAHPRELGRQERVADAGGETVQVPRQVREPVEAGSALAGGLVRRGSRRPRPRSRSGRCRRRARAARRRRPSR